MISIKKKLKCAFLEFVVGNKFYPPESPPKCVIINLTNAIISTLNNTPMPPLQSPKSIEGTLQCARCNKKIVSNIIATEGMICIYCARKGD